MHHVKEVSDRDFETEVLQSAAAGVGRFLGAVVWSVPDDCRR